jgi:hypothetical protein
MASDQNLLLNEHEPRTLADVARERAWLRDSESRPHIPGDVGFPPGSAQTRKDCKEALDSAFKGLAKVNPLDPDTYPPDLIRQLNDSKLLASSDTWKSGRKFDQNKPRMDLLDSEFLEGVANVLGFGANKYAAHNWRGGINISRLIAAAYRHLGAINRGEDIDPESGLPHAHHLGCTVMFLSWMMAHKPELDDRWKK